MAPEVKNLPTNAGDTRYGLDPWVGKIPLEEEIATQSSILDWKIPSMVILFNFLRTSHPMLHSGYIKKNIFLSVYLFIRSQLNGGAW